MVEKFSVNWFSAPTFLAPLWSPLYLSSLIYSFPSRCLCGSRFVWFIETNHSSCPCKHLSYFHSFSLSNPVGPTTASDHKHTCTFTSTEAHSGNKSPAFLCFFFYPLSQSIRVCVFPSLCNSYIYLMYSSVKPDSNHTMGTKGRLEWAGGE